MPRLLNKPWIQAYVDFVTPFSQSPVKFHEWSAISVIGATLKRHVWVDRTIFKLYPNTYVILVGRPATGKGSSVHPAVEILREASTANVLAHRLTIEYALDTMAKGFAHVVAGASGISIAKDHSAIVFAPELSTFLRKNTDALSDLTEIWDAKDKYDYGTRGSGLKVINNPCLSLLGATTTAWLAKSIPQDSVGGGFTRRVNFVYTKSDPVIPDWDVHVNGNFPLRNALIDDLRYMANALHGPFKVTSGFVDAYQAMKDATKFIDFEDEVTTGFKASKWVNIVKAAMIVCASRGDDMTLCESDFLKAQSLIDEVETDLQMVFRAVGESDDATAASKILEFIEKRGYTNLGEIMHALWKHVSRDDAMRILATFVEAGIITELTRGQRVTYKFNLPVTGGQP